VPPASSLLVFAASSLTDAFTECGKAFESRHPGLHVELHFAGTQQLALELDRGARPDVFATADPRWMDELKANERVWLGSEDFATTRLVVIVPSLNRASIRSLEDLGRPGVRIALGRDQTAIGHYSRVLVRNLSKAPGFGDSLSRRLLANAVMQEADVKAVEAKVAHGQADAGIIYRSELTPALLRRVRPIPIPDSLNVTATYSISVVRDTPRPERALEMVKWMRTSEAQAIMKRHRFLPPPGQGVARRP
jgi:molybdate transport system substrate-binding protein